MSRSWGGRADLQRIAGKASLVFHIPYSAYHDTADSTHNNRDGIRITQHAPRRGYTMTDRLRVSIIGGSGYGGAAHIQPDGCATRGNHPAAGESAGRTRDGL